LHPTRQQLHLAYEESYPGSAIPHNDNPTPHNDNTIPDNGNAVPRTWQIQFANFVP
jgi:hypothetical protein